MIEHSLADLKQYLSEKDRIDHFKACQSLVVDNPKPNDGGDDDPEFDRGWNVAATEEKRFSPFLEPASRDREAAEKIDSRRELMARHILNVGDGTLAGLTYQDAIVRYKAISMLDVYYRFDACLQCRKWLEQAKTDPRADSLLRHLVALIVSLGEPIPPSLRNWVSTALFTDRPERRRGPKPMNWRRDQKITLAIDILVKLTNSKLKDALEIVAAACRKEGLIDADPETIKNRHGRRVAIHPG